MTPAELHTACQEANRALRFGLVWGLLFGAAIGSLLTLIAVAIK